MRKLGLHHLTVIDTDPVSLVDIAARTGCHEVSVFTRAPGAHSALPLVDRDNCAALRAALQAHGVRVGSVESFLLTPDSDPQSFAPALELGAEIGAQRAGVQLFDPDEARVIDRVSTLCDMAAALGLQVAIEFMPLSPAWKTLGAMVELIKRIARPGLACGIDMLHLVRSGGTAAEVAALEPRLVGYAQLCDGASLEVTADYATEAVGNRLAPGDGVFPLGAFLQALPPDTPLELEVPQPPTAPPLERARRIVSAARGVIDGLSEVE